MIKFVQKDNLKIICCVLFLNATEDFLKWLTYDCHLCEHPGMDDIHGNLHVLVPVLKCSRHVGNTRQTSQRSHFLKA
jgi:hypothetical protein